MVIPDLKDKTTLHYVCRHAVAIASLILVRSSVQKIRFISPQFFISFSTESKYSVVGVVFSFEQFIRSSSIISWIYFICI